MRRIFDACAVRPCGCRPPYDPGNLCPSGRALYAAESAARDVWLQNRADPRARAAYAAARQAYDRHVGLDSTIGIQE